MQIHAVINRRYSTDYAGQEAEAKAAKRGPWAGALPPPADWRKGERAVSIGFAVPGGPNGPNPAPAKRLEQAYVGCCKLAMLDDVEQH